MRATSFIFLAGCSQILGISTFQSNAQDATGSDGGGPDTHESITPCDELGSDLAITGITYESAKTFGQAACSMLASSAVTSVELDDATAFDTTSISNGMVSLGTVAAYAQVVSVDTELREGLALGVIVATTFKLDQLTPLEIIGANPLVVLASGEITIDGDIAARGDVESTSTCTAGSVGQSSGGGGAGGGFQTEGGAGGASRNGSATPGSTSTGATYYPYPGCAGGGGAGNSKVPFPGGGLYLISQTRISITGGISAGGSGGQVGGEALAGGVGGASGGTIILEAPTIDHPGMIAANGGGGASGADGSGQANPGENATGAQQAQGGVGVATPADGAGGLGGANARSGTDGAAADTTVGGGGGGGGAGFIIVHASQITGAGATSPALTVKD